MTDLLKTISDDLSIMPYDGESDFDYCYRVCYSALALSLLYSARSIQSGSIGISKKAQTDLIQRMLLEYEKHLNMYSKRFISESNSFITQCRKVYEETGYMISDHRGFEVVASYGRTVPIASVHLYFGIPEYIVFQRGLGIYTTTSGNETNIFDAFLRDTLSSDEFIASSYNPLDFEYRDIDKSSLEFFNPSLKKPPSSSWGSEIWTKRTIARSRIYHTMYRVICEDDGRLIFANIPIDADKDSLASYDTRRLFFALKEQSGEPTVAWLNRIDNNYYEIRLSAQLPTREYYFLLLCSWPKRDAFDRISFVTTKEFIPAIEMVLNNISIKTIRRENHV